MTERLGISERYGRATHSSDLRQRERPCDPDKLAAMAWADRQLATPIYRAKVANDPYAIRNLHDLWRDECLKMAERRMWTVTMPAKTPKGKEVTVEVFVPTLLVREIARISLDWWLLDVCPVCFGRKYRLQIDVLTEAGAVTPEQAAMIGRDVLSDDLCPACGGTGKSPIDAPNYLLPLVRKAVEALESRYRQAGGEAIRRLASVMRDAP